ncbi:hypothetical protein AC249_AIPGENE5432, partial [Exaiptasia diaphana]
TARCLSNTRGSHKPKASKEDSLQPFLVSTVQQWHHERRLQASQDSSQSRVVHEDDFQPREKSRLNNQDSYFIIDLLTRLHPMHTSCTAPNIDNEY